MHDLLSDLLELVDDLPVSADEKAHYVQRIAQLGQGAPQAAGGSRYAELSARLVARYPAPSGPGGPKPPPPPP